MRAETRLRGAGLTGAKALDELILGLRHRLEGVPAGALAREAAALVPLPGSGQEVDLLGLAYERFFSDLFKGARGQYFTPPTLVTLLLDRLQVAPGERVLDPTCGSGGLLVEAGRRGAIVHGVELDPQLAELARLNLRLAGLTPEVVCADVFASEVAPADVVVANPPFSVPLTDPATLRRHGWPGERALSDHLFLHALSTWVRPGGRAGVVVPWSVVANARLEGVRTQVQGHFAVRAICALPEGVFRPFGGAAGKAALLWLDRLPSVRRGTAWASLTDPGYDVRSKTLKRTSQAEAEALGAGQGWCDLADGAWVPSTQAWQVPVRPLGEVATLRREPVRPAGGPARRLATIDLADADRRTGEIPAVTVVPAQTLKGARETLHSGDVVVAKLRPALGNVAVVPAAPAGASGVVGSPEWAVLRCDHPQFLMHALRSPAWRSRLPLRSGQTRPRLDAAQLLATSVPWPGDAVVAAVDALSAQIFAERASLLARLAALQEAVDAFAHGTLVAGELADVVHDLASDGTEERA